MRLGIDIGGQSVKIGLVDESGKLLDQVSFPVDLSLTGNEICDRIYHSSEYLMSKNGFGISDVDFAGVGVPGRVDYGKGIVLHTPNLSLGGYPLAERLSFLFRFPVISGNDADCAALGEYLFGSGHDFTDIVFITLGTGVGGGIIINGRLLQGHSGAAGEIGHMVICHEGLKCGCGRNGCFEQYASASALVRMTRETMMEDADSLMWTVAGSIQNVSGKTAFEAAELKDRSAEKVISRYFEYLSVGIINLVNIFEPDAVIIGGGISHEKPENFIIPLEEKINRRITELNTVDPPKIITAVLGNCSGMIGAAFLDHQF